MVKILKVLLNESTMYKYIQMPQGGKVLSYYDLGDNNFTNADEWNVEIDNEQQLK